MKKHQDSFRDIRVLFFVIALILAGVMMIFPGLDILITSHFYVPNIGFIYGKEKLVELSFRAVPFISKIWASLCMLALFAKFLSNRTIKETIKSPAIFLIITALLGPALTVNYLFKENMGRARPREIVEFGGDKIFAAPLEYSTECSSNCSFSSGHAAMAFYFTALAFLVPAAYQRLTFILASFLGFVVGFGRILQGGHFFSDVLFSFIVIMIINEVIFWAWRYYAFQK